LPSAYRLFLCRSEIDFASRLTYFLSSLLKSFSPVLKGRFAMGIEIVDMVGLAHKEKRRKNIFNTPRFHAWMHYYPREKSDEMHCHNADQTFYVIEGECTMSFPDGGRAVLKPGMAALITGGSFYRLENTGDGPMILMGNRSGPAEKIQIIDYVTRKDVGPNTPQANAG
jgi:mannose-6-phosphate isomerase-like protein (cupin superfamily)